MSIEVLNEGYDSSSPLPPSGGGTGQTSYTNGQLLIGDTGTGGLDKATLTAGANITITNGPGSITIAASGGGGSPGGSDTQIQFNNSSAFGGVAGLTVNKTSGAVTQLQTALAATRTPGITLTNPTAAAAGAQQNSPSLRLTGQGWKTTATAASQTVDFDVRVVPVQGAANPSASLTVASQINGAGFTDIITVSETGLLTAVAVTTSGSVSSGANVSAASTGVIFWGSKALLKSPLDGRLQIQPNAGTTGFVLLAGTDGVTIRNNADGANGFLTCAVLTAAAISGTSGTFTGTLVTGNGQNIGWSGLSLMRTATDGNIILSNNAQNAFNLLQFGGTTSSFPALKRSSASLIARLADDSGDATFEANDLILGKTITPAGTTGAQTINKAIGSVNFAAAATSIVVTNSLATVNSVITGNLGGNDTTAVFQSITVAAGSFTIRLKTAPTAEVPFMFHLFN